jgi:hypothetical protein
MAVETAMKRFMAAKSGAKNGYIDFINILSYLSFVGGIVGAFVAWPLVAVTINQARTVVNILGNVTQQGIGGGFIGFLAFLVIIFATLVIFALERMFIDLCYESKVNTQRLEAIEALLQQK